MPLTNSECVDLAAQWATITRCKPLVDDTEQYITPYNKDVATFINRMNDACWTQKGSPADEPSCVLAPADAANCCVEPMCADEWDTTTLGKYDSVTSVIGDCDISQVFFANKVTLCQNNTGCIATFDTVASDFATRTTTLCNDVAPSDPSVNPGKLFYSCASEAGGAAQLIECCGLAPAFKDVVKIAIRAECQGLTKNMTIEAACPLVFNSAKATVTNLLVPAAAVLAYAFAA